MFRNFRSFFECAVSSLAIAAFFFGQARAQEALPPIDVGGVERFEATNATAAKTEEKEIGLIAEFCG